MNSKILTNNSELRVLYTNIQSLSRNFNELLLYLNSTDPAYDIIALSETWISENQLKLFTIKGYRSFMQPRMDGRRSGGVVMYVREHINVKNVARENLITGNVLRLQLTAYDSIKGKEIVISLILVYRDCTSSKKEIC